MIFETKTTHFGKMRLSISGEWFSKKKKVLVENKILIICILIILIQAFSGINITHQTIIPQNAFHRISQKVISIGTENGSNWSLKMSTNKEK